LETLSIHYKQRGTGVKSIKKKKKKAQYQLWLTNESSSVDLPSFCLENNAVGESDRLSEPVPSWSRESARGRARR
jgi:hypothetical protein